MNDFTLSQYRHLIEVLRLHDYRFQTFGAYLEKTEDKVVLLRHDVDARNHHSLNFAQIQHEYGIKGSYYFRFVPQSYDETIIRKISSLGHEIGYHYETMDTCKGDIDKAYDEFCQNLEKLRKLVPITTICMHGSPRSPYDNKDLWQKYDYRKLGIIGEPYFDVDFTKVAYLTDTGRKWNGTGVSMRDKVDSPFMFNFKSTLQIIRQVNTLPDQVMFTFHPQRWTDNQVLWFKELVFQKVKNVVKWGLIRVRKDPANESMKTIFF